MVLLPHQIQLQMSFLALGLSKQLLNTLQESGYEKAYPIQQKAIPAILKGADILGIAKTGSGKTASFVLPIIQQLGVGEQQKNRHVQVLVLVPTRELAIQVQEVFQLFNKNTDVKSLAVFGGVSINPQMIKLQGVDVLVATPGRLLDLVNHNAVHLTNLKTLVIDEADKMLTLGFKDELDKIFQLLPSKRQNLLFSATLSDEVGKINRFILHNPEVIKITSEPEKVEQIKQVAYEVSEEKKGPLLRYLLNQFKGQQVLIFTSSHRKADNVGHKLRKNGFNCEAIHSKKSQGARTAALKEFKAGRLPVLIATDLLSRGIDIAELPCVINYELPRSPKDYVHRIGRTGRADAVGNAISFITSEDEHHFKVIQKKMKKWVTRINSENLDLG